MKIGKVYKVIWDGATLWGSDSKAQRVLPYETLFLVVSNPTQIFNEMVTLDYHYTHVFGVQEAFDGFILDEPNTGLRYIQIDSEESPL